MKPVLTTKSKNYYGGSGSDKYSVSAIGHFHGRDLEHIEVLHYDSEGNETDITDFVYDHLDSGFINDMEQEILES